MSELAISPEVSLLMEMNGRMVEMQQQINALVAFTETVVSAVSGMASQGGMTGMMMRSSLPPGLLDSLSKVG